ncbi:MAG TPA: formyltransferase family protein [Hydrogenophaga sp.]|uniref:formyltransferase family protein n=1 Tax=Hydrogenophaga sp. TaxID=1904254 RepID=UPI002C768EC8|nr:formyltransferase family protein [Hydrogenophaga sp.]HSX94070.1 formyltransferase family protein [Hydrogenophaga sp.]
MVRIAVFGSFYRGYCLLDALLHGPHRGQFRVVGVATDDVDQGFVSRERRVWQYPHEPWEARMVAEQAARHGLPLHTGRVKTDAFRRVFREHWCPDLCIAATFGQRIDAPLFNTPPLGFYNLHPCVQGPWPSPYAGPNPFQALIDDGRDHAVVALHHVDDGFDTGEIVAWSERIPLPPGATVVDMHKLSSPVAAHFAVSEMRRIVERARRAALARRRERAAASTAHEPAFVDTQR